MITAAYLGHIGESLDFDLLEKLAQEKIVMLFMGPIASSRFNDLLKYRNVIWLGEQKQEKAGYILYLVNVGLMPFVATPLTIHLNPNKVYEYMACGLPIVSTNIYAKPGNWASFVHLSKDHEDFIRLVKEVPKVKNTQSMTFSGLNTWDDKARSFTSLITSLKAETSTPLPI